jgi:hypothetical protein
MKKLFNPPNFFWRIDLEDWRIDFGGLTKNRK